MFPSDTDTQSDVKRPCPWDSKIGDFGLAVAVAAGAVSHESDGPLTELLCIRTTGLGTPLYAAPEQQAPRASATYGPSADVFALGMTLFDMLFRTAHTDPTDRTMCLNQFRHRDLETPGVRAAQSAAPDLFELALRMTDSDPSRRPSIAEVCDFLARPSLR